ncbi:serine/threonine-protein kinase [Frankia sp. EI5c]|uniref:serine/threonine-protein kinase n=1 Tax=Frankia sp. EI5c TaxID=683316 RepID=UPI0037C0D8AA
MHNLDIVRLDVKPSNIIISTDGRPVIIDFGVARSFERDSTQVTGDGLVGTPAYMAPEQITGQPVDHRTDIFSFGLVLLELFGGAHPGAGSIENVMFRRVYEDVDVAPLTCSQELKALIRKCCRRDRELRYSNGTELYQALLAVPEENATLPPNAFGWVTSRVSDAGGDPDSTASPGEHGSGIPRFRPSDPNDPNSTRVLI